jgi:hypothetical protein
MDSYGCEQCTLTPARFSRHVVYIQLASFVQNQTASGTNTKSYVPLNVLRCKRSRTFCLECLFIRILRRINSRVYVAPSEISHSWKWLWPALNIYLNSLRIWDDCAHRRSVFRTLGPAVDCEVKAVLRALCSRGNSVELGPFFSTDTRPKQTDAVFQRVA